MSDQVAVRFHRGDASWEEEHRMSEAQLQPVIYRYVDNRATDDPKGQQFEGGYRRRGDSLDYDYDPAIDEPTKS